MGDKIDQADLAQSIAEGLLAKTGAGMMSGDFDMFADCFTYPNEVETINGVRVLKTRQAMQDLYDDIHKYFRVNGISHMERHVIVSAFKTPDTITCTHQSRLFSGPNLVQAPYPVFSIIKRGFDQAWRIAFGSYGMAEFKETDRAISASLLDGTDIKDTP